MENINCSRREGNQDNTGGIHSGQATEKCAFNTFLAMALVNDFFLEFFFDIHTKICFSKFCWLYLCLPCTVRFNTLRVSCGGETTSTNSPLGKIGRLISSHTYFPNKLFTPSILSLISAFRETQIKTLPREMKGTKLCYENVYLNNLNKVSLWLLSTVILLIVISLI